MAGSTGDHGVPALRSGLTAARRIAIGALVFQLAACSNEHFVLGDSYASIMAPYVAAHTGCPVHDYSHSGRLAAEILVEDLDAIGAEVDALEPQARPVVILSAGAIDEALWGPQLAALILDELARELLALHPDLVLLQLDYGENFHLGFWDRIALDEHPRWKRVMFPEIVDHEISDDGLHLPKPAYVERLFSLARQDPSILCQRPGAAASTVPPAAGPLSGPW